MYPKPPRPIILLHEIEHDGTNAIAEPGKISLYQAIADAQDLHDRLGPDRQVVLRRKRYGHWRFQIEKLDGDHVTKVDTGEEI